MADFDPYADRYKETVARSIGFANQGHDFFVMVKARLLMDLMHERLGDPAAQSILDVGCGVGTLSAAMAGQVKALYGIDTSAKSVDTAQQEVPGSKFQSYDGIRFPYDDGTFDLAFTVCVLHHIPVDAWPGFVQEMRRVLRPGGLAVIIEHNPYNPLTRIVVNRCSFDADAVLLSASTSLNLLLNAGFADVTRRYFTFLPFRHAIVPKIEQGIWWLPLGAQYCAVGTNPTWESVVF